MTDENPLATVWNYFYGLGEQTGQVVYRAGASVTAPERPATPAPPQQPAEQPAPVQQGTGETTTVFRPSEFSRGTIATLGAGPVSAGIIGVHDLLFSPGETIRTEVGAPVVQPPVTRVGEPVRTVRDLGGGRTEIIETTRITTEQGMTTPVKTISTPVPSVFEQVFPSFEKQVSERYVKPYLPEIPEEAFTGLALVNPAMAPSVLGSRLVGKITGMDLPTPPEVLGSLWYGEYQGIRERPVTAAAAAGAGIIFGGMFKTLEYGTTTGAEIASTQYPRAAKALTTLNINVLPKALTGIYAVDVTMRSTEQFTDTNPRSVSRRLGGILSTETIPMGIGFGVGHAAPGEIYRQARMQEIDIKAFVQEQYGIRPQQYSELGYREAGRVSAGYLKASAGEVVDISTRPVRAMQIDYASFVQERQSPLTPRQRIIKDILDIQRSGAFMDLPSRYDVKEFIRTGTSLGFEPKFQTRGELKARISKAPGILDYISYKVQKPLLETEFRITTFFEKIGRPDLRAGLPEVPAIPEPSFTQPPGQGRMGAKTVGGREVRGLAPEPSLKSMGINEQLETGAPARKYGGRLGEPSKTMKPWDLGQGRQAAITLPVLSEELPGTAQATALEPSPRQIPKILALQVPRQARQVEEYIEDIGMPVSASAVYQLQVLKPQFAFNQKQIDKQMAGQDIIEEVTQRRKETQFQAFDILQGRGQRRIGLSMGAFTRLSLDTRQESRIKQDIGSALRLEYETTQRTDQRTRQKLMTDTIEWNEIITIPPPPIPPPPVPPPPVFPDWIGGGSTGSPFFRRGRRFSEIFNIGLDISTFGKGRRRVRRKRK